jgi:monoamine oxidase
MATNLYNPDVVVVGAGLSGLRTAREVQNAGLSCVVLESLDRVGGRTLSMPTKENGKAPVDLGAAWINDSSQTEMFALAQAFGFDLVKQRAEGISIYQDELGNITPVPYDMESVVRPHFSHFSFPTETTLTMATALTRGTWQDGSPNNYHEQVC